MGPDLSHEKGHIWGGMTLGFSHMLPSAIPSGPDVGIFPHAIDQHSNWMAVEEIECHIKFF